MAEHHNTAKQAIKEHSRDMFKPSSYKVNIKAHDFIRVFDGSNPYDLVLLDRDCTLQEYHGEKVPMKFWYYLREGPSKADGGRSKLEIISNSSFDEFKKIRDIFAKFDIPVNKLVKFEGGIDNIYSDDAHSDNPYLLRFDENGELSVHQYMKFNSERGFFYNETKKFAQGDKLLANISYNYKKPNPLTVESVVDFNITNHSVPENPEVLMVGDRYMTDIMAGNLAGVDTALVKPYKPLSDRPGLILQRYLIDIPIGTIMNKIAHKR